MQPMSSFEGLKALQYVVPDATCPVSTALNRNIVTSRAWMVNWSNFDDMDTDDDISFEDDVYDVMDP